MSELAREQVVITGVGPISVIGTGREAFCAALQRGNQPAAESGPLGVEDFAVEDYLTSEKTYLDRCSEFALAAAVLALDDAQLDWRGGPHPRWGLALGTAFGCLDSMLNNTIRVQNKGARFASPIIFMHSMANSPASLVAIEYGLEGPNPTFCDGDISAGTALHYAWHALVSGQADVMLAGGVDVLSKALLARLSAEPDRPGPRPATEGAAVLVLEKAEAAAARGARPLGEIAGCGLASGSDGDEAREQALKRAVAASGSSEAPVEFDIPGGYGYTFGAGLALDTAAAIGLNAAQEQGLVSIARATSSGRAAAIILREAR